MNLQALVFTDFYKTDHRRQYPEGTEFIYSNLTARSSRIDGIDGVVFFGLQYFIKRFLTAEFNKTFFNLPKDIAVAAYSRRLNNALGPNAVPMDHIEALHDLGFLPLKIKALPEGTVVPIQIPCLTVENTHAKFAWLTNFIETMLSATLWGPCTSATIARQYRKTFEKYADKTGADKGFIDWQGHDFSFRGMFGIEAACLSGAGHLLSFTGTDTIPAIDFLEEYYNANSNTELIGGSVPATEHAVMCAGGHKFEEELATYKRLITEVYPTGIVSIVSDTWDFWKVVTQILASLKQEILNRNGKVVIRPDSGDPVKILTGDPLEPFGTPQNKGLIQELWDTFGGTINSAGYKVLDSHVGAIYGDSITLDRQAEILHKLYTKGFASSNVVLGIGSYTYQHVTRDTFGFAVKATHCVVRGESRDIFKTPKTDLGKSSHRGLISVYRDDEGLLRTKFPASTQEEASSLLQTVFLNGNLIKETSLKEIRQTLKNQ